MNRHEFEAFGRERTAQGQHELADAMRVLVARDAPEIYDALAEGGEEAFLEPLLFTYFSETEPLMGLPQIVFGAVPAALRPDAIEIETDSKGRAYLPKIGYFLTEERNAPLVLSWDRATDRYALSRDERPVSFRLETPWIIPGTTIEVVRYENPLLNRRLLSRCLLSTSAECENAEVEIDGRAERHLGSLERAFAYLAEHCPDYFKEILGVMREVVVFSHPNVNCFASIRAHGMVFFNARDNHDEPFFFDELAHQCGHVIFNAMTVRRKDFLAMNPAGPLSDIAPNEPGRNIYDAFHGLYTEHMMSRSLRILDERHVFSGRKGHELFGRLSFIARKYRIDLRNLSVDGVFTDLGASVYGFFRDTFDELYRARPELYTTDMSGQPYNFDFEAFARNNPPPHTEATPRKHMSMEQVARQ